MKKTKNKIKAFDTLYIKNGRRYIEVVTMPEAAKLLNIKNTTLYDYKYRGLKRGRMIQAQNIWFYIKDSLKSHITGQ
jgi:hypothetical protein